MILSESLYFIIMFTLPAAMHIIYNAHIRIVPRCQPDKSVELAESIIFCAIVFFLNIIILNKSILDFANYLLLDDAEKQISSFNYLKFMITYSTINLLTSLFIIVFWYKVGNKIFLYIVNKINKIDNRALELEFPDVWRNIFESNKLIEVFNTCIVIEQNNTIITAGFLQTFQPPNNENRELLLYNTEQIKEILNNDKEEPPENKVFYPALYEYYDGKSNLLLKFYALDNYNKKYVSKDES